MWHGPFDHSSERSLGMYKVKFGIDYITVGKVYVPHPTIIPFLQLFLLFLFLLGTHKSLFHTSSGKLEKTGYRSTLLCISHQSI